MVEGGSISENDSVNELELGLDGEYIFVDEKSAVINCRVLRRWVFRDLPDIYIILSQTEITSNRRIKDNPPSRWAPDVITINCFKVYHRLAGPDKYRRVSPVCSKGEIYRFCILL